MSASKPSVAVTAAGGLLFLGPGACGPPTWPEHNGTSIPDGPPAITAFELLCDLESEEWELTVEADAWTGGGDLYLTVDGIYVEAHGVDSDSAAADGSADELELELDMVGDWREVNEGSSTVFTCGAEADALFVLYDLEGEPTDCRAAGPDADRWGDIDGAVACTETEDISF